MKLGLSLINFIAISLSLVLTAVAYATPANTEAYSEQRGGFVQLPFGSYVEGSARHGGIQPDYRISADDPALKEFLERIVEMARVSPEILQAEQSGDAELVKNLKIALLAEAVSNALPMKKYDSSPYRKVLKEHRDQGKDINLGAYLQCQAGVCRENALLTHQGLRALGITSYFVYTKVHIGNHVEDHAIVVVKDKYKLWIVDPYNITFHGRDFNEVMQQSAWKSVTRSVAPFANPTNYVGRILKVLKYPSYWIPNSALCKSVFL
ncbi:transglutaminase-like domain-containing protein [Bdellovibrio sp. HCB209]|uniref:transglutaminase-like domain-containing protein n=1 Tax=Bdellovibrio sp. HCB209 TaxID=3394354 RepID=UPI0039B5DE50